jgi:glyoxylase I family protein
MSSDHRLTHVGLCVRHLERSVEFYCEAMGFNELRRLHVEDQATAQLLDVPGLKLDLVYLHRDGFRLELLGYSAPSPLTDDRPHAMNALGFTHLSFRVDAPEVLLERVEKHGGRLWPERTVTFDGGSRGFMVSDPDGNWLELIERGDPRR